MKISKSIWDQLVRTLASDNEALATDAFVRFYYFFCPELESALRSYIPDKDRVRDFTQETFALIWRDRKGLYSIKDLKAYYFAAARNLTRRDFNEMEKTREALDEYYTRFGLSDHHGFFKTQEYADCLPFIEVSIAKLDPKLREIFHQAVELGHSHEVIQKLTGLSLSAIKQRKRKALAKVRQELEKRLRSMDHLNLN